MAHASDRDGFNRVSAEEKVKEMPVSHEEEEEEQHSSVQETASANKEQPLLSDLELKKQRLLEDLDSAFLPKHSMAATHQDLPPPIAAAALVPPSIGLGLGYEVIDETALVETLSLPSAAAAASGIGKGNRNGNGNGKGKKEGTNANVAEAKKNANKRRKAKKEARDNRARRSTAEAPNGKTKKIRYSRKEMEILRFVNLDQQRNFWNAVYAGLQTHFASEYDTLAASSSVSANGPRPLCLPNNKQAPPILSVGAANGRWRYMNVFVH